MSSLVARLRARAWVTLSILVVLSDPSFAALYHEADGPRSYREGEEITLYVNKLTSTTNLFPVDHYHLPFCYTEGSPKFRNQDIGQYLAGDRIYTSPYQITMKKDMYCEQLCVSNLGRSEMWGVTQNKVIRAIRNHYHENWILDGLPSASRSETDQMINTRYSQGFPLGYVDVDVDGPKAFINNHVNIEIQYNPVGDDQFRVVRFTVQPFSIRHEFDEYGEQDDAIPARRQIVKMRNPIASCDPRTSPPRHTTYDMVTEGKQRSWQKPRPGKIRRQPQLASGKVLFTYDVIWIERPDLKWADRWDVYVSMDGAVPYSVHWMSILNSLVMVAILAATVVAVIVRNLRRDYTRYSRATSDEGERRGDQSGYKWMDVRADVFRVPSCAPLMSVCCGTGAQLLCTSLLVIALTATGQIQYVKSGRILLSSLGIFIAMAPVNGYVTARFLRMFRLENWAYTVKVAALAFPCLVLGIFTVVNLLALLEGSTYAVPFGVCVVSPLWVGLSSGLTYAGAHFGIQQDPMCFPVEPSNEPRPIPEPFAWVPACAKDVLNLLPFDASIPFTILAAGLLPWSICFIENYYILSSLWFGHWYSSFGVLLLTLVLFILSCAGSSIIFVYSQLCREDHAWWWRAFAYAGTSGFHLFLYSLVGFAIEANTLSAFVLFVGYMMVVCIGVSLMAGFVGVTASLGFLCHKSMYGRSFGEELEGTETVPLTQHQEDNIVGSFTLMEEGDNAEAAEAELLVI